MSPSITCVRRATAAALPFIAVCALFAGALAWHLDAPARAQRAFEQALAAPPPTDLAPGDWIQLERLSCGGPCVAYRVRLEAAGRLWFDGRQGACAGHVGPLAIDGASVRRLIAAADRAGYAAWPDPGHRREPTGPLSRLELRRGASIQRRLFDQGGPDDPPQLAAVARAVDAVAGVSRWLPAADGRCAPPAAGPGARVPTVRGAAAPAS